MERKPITTDLQSSTNILRKLNYATPLTKGLRGTFQTLGVTPGRWKLPPYFFDKYQKQKDNTFNSSSTLVSFSYTWKKKMNSSTKQKGLISGNNIQAVVQESSIARWSHSATFLTTALNTHRSTVLNLNILDVSYQHLFLFNIFGTRFAINLFYLHNLKT